MEVYSNTIKTHTEHTCVFGRPFAVGLARSLRALGFPAAVPALFFMGLPMVIRQYSKYMLHSRVMMFVECEMSIVGDCALPEINRHLVIDTATAHTAGPVNQDDFVLKVKI